MYNERYNPIRQEAGEGSVCVFLFYTAYQSSQVAMLASPRKQNKALRGNVEMAAAISKVHQINTWTRWTKLTAERDKR